MVKEIGMAVVRVSIEPSILNWVINNVSFDDIGYERSQTLSDWIAGKKAPTFNQIETFSRASHIPLGYFFLKNPPAEVFPILNYRTIGSVADDNLSRNLADTIHNMESVQIWMRDYLLSVGNDKSSIVSSASINDPIITVANKIRTDLGLQNDWATQTTDPWDAFKYFRKAMENAGILIMMNGVVGNNTHRKLNIEEFRAFILIDEYAPLIFINANDSDAGRLFSLVHEGVHIWIGEEELYNDRYNINFNISPLETFCNAVTAEILVPNGLFITEWNKSNTPVLARIKSLASHFSCGEMVIARRAFDNKFISKEEYKNITSLIIEGYNKKTKKNPGGDYYNTNLTRIDRNFLLALDNSIHEGKTQYTDAFRLTHTTRATFPQVVQRMKDGE